MTIFAEKFYNVSEINKTEENNMIIDKNFIGGNVEVLKIDENTAYVEREMRDSEGDWFYWAFRVRGAAGKTVTFRFPKDMPRVGYYGAAVSHDLLSWKWTNGKLTLDGCDAFSYTFGAEENEVYFAHNRIYPLSRMTALANKYGLKEKTLCLSERGRKVPCYRFGRGEKTIFLASRHHACENTGSYVLEGVLSSLLENPVDGYSVFCVPFVDYDGVLDGDQGKNRLPHDHNRDYDKASDSVYASCAAIRKFIDEHEIALAFDFHSPWHCSGENDREFVVYPSRKQLDALQTFGKLFQASVTEDSLRYKTADDHLPDTGWNNSKSPTFTRYAGQKTENRLSLSLETPYFGEKDDIVTDEKLLRLGECFANAVRAFVSTLDEN